MSGAESAYSIDPLTTHAEARPEDIAQFVQTGYDGASQLYDAVRKHWTDSNGGEGYSPLYNKNTGQDLSALWSAYMDWTKKRNATIDQHDEYLKLKGEQPGRDSTVVGFTAEKAGTVLGQKLPYQKTVLG
jgi:hypothetical protein